MDTVQKLFRFLDESPTCYHAAANAKAALTAAGAVELRESEQWKLEKGTLYVVERGDSALVAFRVPEGPFHGFLMAASHSDSPTFKVRETAEAASAGNTLRLSVEPYGGGVWRGWLDRPLSVAGRVMIRQGDRLVSRLVNIDRDLLVIPGVAIATALMPPLCTAGYGLATLQLNYFLGAFYLFFINTVFIAIATFVVVRFLKYRKKEFLDKGREARVRRSMLLIVLVTIVPSVVIGYRIVKRSFFETNAQRYVSNVFQFPKAKAIDFHTHFDSDSSSIEVFMIGEPVSKEAIESARLQMAGYGLSQAKLIVRQNGEDDHVDLVSLQSGYRELIAEKNRRIGELERKLSAYATDTLPSADIAREMRAMVPSLREVSLSKTIRYGSSADTLVLCVVRTDGRLPAAERAKIETWLRARTRTDSLKLYIE